MRFFGCALALSALLACAHSTKGTAGGYQVDADWPQKPARIAWGHMPGVAEFGGREVGHLYYGLRVG